MTSDSQKTRKDKGVPRGKYSGYNKTNDEHYSFTQTIKGLGIKSDLEIEEWQHFMQEPCVCCGSKPAVIVLPVEGSLNFQTASPICKKCKSGVLDYGIPQFILHCKRVARNNEQAL